MTPVAQQIRVSEAAFPPIWKQPIAWRTAAVLGLVAWLYTPILLRLSEQWRSDPNFSHGFFVPLFSLFVVWQSRHRLEAISRKPSNWGLPIIAISLCTLLLGAFGAELFLSRISFLLLTTGLIVFFLGWETFRIVLFPLIFLILMVPIPALVFNQITFPLQIFASKLSAWVLPFLGVPVLREGNVINLPAMPLEVADACSGIRSLMTLTTLTIMYGYLLEKRVLMRVLLAVAAVPIAVIANGFRIVGTGLLVQYWDPDKAQGFFHEFSGWLIFVFSLFMLFFLHRGLMAFYRRREVPA